VTYPLGAGRKAIWWRQRRITVNGVEAQARDGVAIADEAAIMITALDEAELVLVDTL